MSDDADTRAKMERVIAGIKPGRTGGVEVIDPDPDGWAADLCAVLDARAKAKKRDA